MNTTYYSRSHDGHITSSRQKFDSNLLTAAHRTLPLGTKLKLTNPSNEKSVVVTVNDRGPYAKGRDLSITRKAAEELGFIKEGHAKLKVEKVE
jgi:rare lipoprotein A